MKRELGIARCGLACCICHENASCAGCLSDGCKDREWCKNRRCTLERGLKGCWECSDFPCKGGMLDKPRIRAFSEYVKQYGIERMMDCLEKNEKDGVLYHYPDEIVGDYDCFTTREAVWDAIENGLCYRGMLVKEGLRSEEVLDDLQIERAEVWRTPNTPRYWTAVWFSSRAPRFPDRLSQALGDGWYADMRLGDTKVIALKGKVVRYRIGDAEGKARALDECRRSGVPEAQLDWQD